MHDPTTKFNGNFKHGLTIDFAAQGNAINSIKVDKLGNVYILGRFQSTVDFDPSEKVYNLKSNGLNIFLLKLSQQTTSVEEHITSPSFSVYPNPAENFLAISIHDAPSFTASLFDAQGRRIFQRTVESKLLTLDLSEQQRGVYFLLLASNGKRILRKVVKI